ncbi:MAG TPA: UvrD-helicase domain-containing protein [Bacteroidia bacterium]
MSNNFVIYKSSAGSGKTFTLVKEYLKIALADTQDPPFLYKRILAITFTNKAAAEMKDRVLKALKDLSENRNETLKGILCKELNIESDLLQKRAHKLLFEILHNYGNFSISTIDSFTHTIIRNFSHDLKLPVNFDIETDEREIIAKCTDQLISRIGVDEEVTKLILEFSKSKTDEQKSWQVDQEIRGFAEKILQNSDIEKTSILRELSIADFKEIRKEFTAENKKLEAELKEIGNAFFLLIKKNNIPDSGFYYGAKGVPGYFKKLSEERFDEEGLVNSYINAALHEDKWYGPKTDESIKSAIDSAKRDILSLFHRAQNLVEENLGKYIIRRSILRDLYSLSLINEIEKLIQVFKEEENVLFISEFNQRIAEIISTEPVPFIYEKIGERYKHFLLDEFQDTSVTQWQNLLPLLDNSLAEGNFNLIVGDGKQSIYRWRGGEAEQFDALPELPLIKDSLNKDFWEESLQRNADVRQLEYNYRSLKNVVGFNNDFFEWISKTHLHETWQKIYSTVNQKAQEKATGGLVTIDFLKQDTEDDGELTHTLQYIEQSLSKGYKYKEIVYIVRFNYEGNKVADFLTENGIPVISSDSLLLKNCKEVAFLIDTFTFLSHPDNAVCASSIVNFLCDEHILNKQNKNEYLLKLNTGNLGRSFEELMQQEGIAFKALDFVTLPLLECSIQLINLFRLKNNKNYLQFFLDEIIAFTAYNTNSINAFLEWWDKKQKNASLKIPEGSNAVRIMTIHKSKGLEFPVVIMPFCNWKYEQGDYIWIEPEEGLPVALVKTTKEMTRTAFSDQYDAEKQKQLLDNVNLLYVAFTRAANHLHIISKEPKKGASSVYSFIRIFASQKYNLPESEQHLEIGEATENHHIEKKTATYAYQFDLNNWNRVISIKSNYESSGKKQETENNASVGSAHREHGILIHYILSKVKNNKDVENAIQLSVTEGLLNSSEASQMQKEIIDIISATSIQPFFADDLNIANEIEILSKEGKVLRPDRLIFEDNLVRIVDFKTGKHSDTYIEQLDTYERALNDMGYTCRKYLLYLNERKVMEV